MLTLLLLNQFILLVSCLHFSSHTFPVIFIYLTSNRKFISFYFMCVRTTPMTLLPHGHSTKKGMQFNYLTDRSKFIIRLHVFVDTSIGRKRAKKWIDSHLFHLYLLLACTERFFRCLFGCRQLVSRDWSIVIVGMLRIVHMPLLICHFLT